MLSDWWEWLWKPPVRHRASWWRCETCGVGQAHWAPISAAPLDHRRLTGHQVRTMVMTTHTYEGLTPPCTWTPSSETPETGQGESPAYLPSPTQSGKAVA